MGNPQRERPEHLGGGNCAETLNAKNLRSMFDVISTFWIILCGREHRFCALFCPDTATRIKSNATINASYTILVIISSIQGQMRWI
jgi:hypothetical protein